MIAAIRDLAKLYGFRFHHQRAAVMQSGRWASAIQGDAGFPDCVLVGHGRIFAVEVKGRTGYPNPEQRAWLDALLAAGAETWTMRPGKDLAALAVALDAVRRRSIDALLEEQP